MFPVPPTLASALAPVPPETVPAALPFIDLPFNFVARSPSAAASTRHNAPAAVPAHLAHDLQLSRCRLRIFRMPVEGGHTKYTVLVTELPQGERSDRLANPGRPAMECLDDLVQEINLTYLLKIPDELITWFYHRRSVVSPDRPRRHDELWALRYAAVRADNGLAELHLITRRAGLEELDLAARGLVEL